MKCCFCQRTQSDLQRVNAAYLCPACLAQLLSVSPEDKTYRWFVAAMRRAIAT